MAKNIVKVVSLQHQHIVTLLDRIKELERDITNELLSQKDWHLFIERYIDPHTLKYVTADLGESWYNKELYDYDISYNFYKDKYASTNNDNTLKYLTITIAIKLKGSSYAYCKDSSIPLTVTLVTDLISIDSLDSFLNS